MTQPDLEALVGRGHTPGPWELGAFPLFGGHISISAGNYGIAKVWDQEEGSGFVNAANARLIAAAPELLEALQYVLNEQISPPAARQARAAIAKATGARLRTDPAS